MGRRGNNEGSISGRDYDGRWMARITLDDGKRKAFYGKTRAEVAKKLQEALHDVGRGVPLVDERQTVKQYLTNWYETMRSQIRPSSYRRYGDYINDLVPALGQHSLAKLSPQHLQAFYNRKLAEGLSAATVHAMHSMLQRAFDDALQMGPVSRNVSERLKPPKRGHREMMPLSVIEVRRFLDVVTGDRFYALYVLALSTGMRESELLALRWKDVDLARCIAQVRMDVQETSGRYIVAETKTAYSRRTVALTQAAVDALAAHWQQQQLEEARMGAMYDDTLDLVFPNGYSGIMIPHNITKRPFKRYLIRAGLSRDLRFHDLRHTAATLLLASGVNVKVVSEMLGHSNVSITLSIYAHVLPHMQQSAVSAMDRLLAEPAIVDLPVRDAD
jgi:integrase